MGSDQYRSLKIDNVIEGTNDVAAFGISVEDMTTFAEYLGLEE
jgi:hypothetical protein